MNLHHHDFLSVNIGGKVAAVLARLRAENDQISEREQYAEEVLFAASELAATLDQMKYAVQSLSGYRHINPNRSRFGATRLDHIIFHVENHIIRTVMIVDRSLQLANVVFSLGLPERECSEATVVKNSHLKGTATAKTLGQLIQFVKPVREQRNVIIHRRRHHENGLDKVARFFVLEQYEQAGESTKRVTPKYRWLYKSLTDKYVADKKRELTKINAAAEDLGALLFDALEPEFNRQWQIRNTA